MISRIYKSNQILHKAWSRKGKTREQIALKEERMKDKKVQSKKKIEYYLNRFEEYKRKHGKRKANRKNKRKTSGR